VAAAIAILASGFPVRAQPSEQAVAGPGLTLRDALRLSLQGSLSLRASALSSEAAHARARAAGRAPDPLLSAGFENFGGTLGTRHAEASLGLEQSIELGGDRGARIGLGRALTALAQAQHAELERSLAAETVNRFCDAWVLQERVMRIREAERLAEQAVEAAEQRLQAGAAPSYERTRAVAFRSLREIERHRVEAELEAARRRLTLLWSVETPGMDSLLLPEPLPRPLPPVEALFPRLNTHPSRRRAAAEEQAMEWRIREARATRVPNVGLGAGVRHLAESEGTGFAVGMSLPLPVWNPSHGDVAAARSEQAAAAARARRTELELRGELRTAYGRYLSAVATWEGIRDRVRPAALESIGLISSGYRSGRIGYLEIQEGQRNLLEADLLLIEAAADVWRTGQLLEQLVGAPLEELAPDRER
jgi:cobalt-zinc-cadmium efflux system outer membrane protein